MGNKNARVDGNTAGGSGPTTKGYGQCPRGDRDYNHVQERYRNEDCPNDSRPTTDQKKQQFLNFPFIEHCETIRLLAQFHVMFILRGAPGSGKTTVARAILEQAKDQAIVCSADDFRYNENGEYVWQKEKLEETHNKCKKKAEEFAALGKPSIIIDNTNIRTFEVEPYMKIAQQYGYVVVLVEPKTPWKHQARELVKKTPHNVPLGTIFKRLEDFDEILPYYFGWFLSPEDSVKLPTMAKDILSKSLQVAEFQHFIKAFAARFTEEFTVDDIVSYYLMNEQKEPYHVTACFSPRGKYLGGSPYHKARAVVGALGQISFVSIVGLVVTENTFSARVTLTNTQRKLWMKEDQRCPRKGHGYGRVVSPWAVQGITRSLQKLPLEDSARPVTDRRDNCSDASTHITLGTRQNVNPVQAKYDVEAVINLEVTSEEFEEYTLVDGVGMIRKYSDDVWALYFNQANIMKIPVIFSGHYAQRIVNDFMDEIDDF
ncbi:2',3'-cyclic-nucleotide 3'-phosphodiesterase-like [Dendronephthya gigantea]|uniref:2',3'-cyclic-nucleotide 3'-phosphodiesterase-like n=1 Tax=Dendronephthya gigantea TaxID=151771 RepID=UPI00106BE824|nr:2',3'-cyclic-nucleotide 3'-phosphodiesterase-like [Dendronephthya gigantea]